MLSRNEEIDLKIFAARIRQYTLRAIHSIGSGHVGGAMSIADTLAVLYGREMRILPDDPKWEDRDRFVLSKGHAGPSLYAALALKGFFPIEELYTLNKGGTKLPSHADALKTPGIDYSTGSLGQGISLAVGSACGARIMKKDYYTYCIIGDGECDEGQIWEAALFANQHKVSNMILFIDLNGYQLDGTTEQVCDLGDLSAKWKSFGWHVQEVNGQEVREIADAVEAAKAEKNAPSVIILHTTKGIGYPPALETDYCHYMKISDQELEYALERLQLEIDTFEKQKEN